MRKGRKMVVNKCSCCGSQIGTSRKGVYKAIVKSDVLRDIGEALIAYAGIESVDLITGTVILSVPIEDDEEWYNRLGDIRNELNSYYQQPTVEWAK